MSQSIEGTFGTLFILLVFAVFMFGLYIAREVRRNGFQRMRLQAGISIFVLVGGMSIITGRIWWWLHAAPLAAMKPILHAGAVITILGIICVIRVFAPDRWGGNVWIGSVVFAIAMAILFSFI
jgi:hypothetical protein